MQTTVGEIFSRTIVMFKERAGVLAGMWFTYLAIQILFYGIFIGVVGTSFLAAGITGDTSAAASLGAGMIILMLLFYVGYFYIVSAQAVSMGIMASPLVEPSFGNALTGGFRGGISMLGVYVILFIALFIGAIVFGLVGAIVALLGQIGAFIATIALIGGLLYLACRLLVIAVVIGVDGVRNPISAIVRSWKLTGSNVLPIFLTILIFVAMALIAFLLPLAFFYDTLQGLQGGGIEAAADVIGSLSFMFVMFLILSVVFSILNAAMISSVHANISDTQQVELEETFG